MQFNCTGVGFFNPSSSQVLTAHSDNPNSSNEAVESAESWSAALVAVSMDCGGGDWWRCFLEVGWVVGRCLVMGLKDLEKSGKLASMRSLSSIG